MALAALPSNSAEPAGILHVITCLDVGGAEIALRKLVLSDPSPATRHTVVSLRDLGVVGKELQAAGVSVHALEMGPRMHNARAFLRLVRLISTLRPAVVQTWLYHADLIGGLAARCAGRSEVIWGIRSTGFPDNTSKLTLATMKLCAWLSRWVPRIIVCCAEAARDIHVKWGYDSSKMRVIPNGFELPTLADAPRWRLELRQEMDVSEDCVLVGMIARFDLLKDHRGFIQAAKVVAAACTNVKFMLVGRDVHVGNRALMGWIDEAGLSRRFVLLGERRDVDRCFAAMDVFCLSSIREAFPNVVGEAMAMALPCVVTNVGDAARIVGDTGWVVSTRRPDLLGRAIADVVAMSPEMRRQHGAAARARVLQEFSMFRTQELFQQAYSDASS